MSARIGVPQKILDLPEADTPLDPDDVVVVVQGVVPSDRTRQTTVAAIRGTSLGTTDERPSDLASTHTYTFFDTTLGKPIFWNGSGWVDATGASV